MPAFTFTVTVTCDTAGQASQVMAERIDYEEEYGFPYEVTRDLAPLAIDGESY